VADQRLRLTKSDVDAVIGDPLTFTGTAVRQVADVVRRVEGVVAAHPDAASYRPDGIL
jgi:adenylosuccinate lyase